jgi:predicted TIM-barrel fold metal-dependent hydrolase
VIVDIHSHIYPPSYLEALARRGAVPRLESRSDGDHLLLFDREEELLGATPPLSPGFFRIEEKLAFMERSGIDRSVVSLGNPWLDFVDGHTNGGASSAASWANSLNHELSELAASHEQILALGIIPLQDPEAAVNEIRQIAADPHLRGVMIGTHTPQGWLDDSSLEPVWAALEEAALPVFIHPHYGVGYRDLTGYGHSLLLALGFPFETTVAATRLILSGLFDRYPRLRLVLAHGGGALPVLAGRLEKCVQVDADARRRLQRPIREYLRMLYLDALTYDPASLTAAKELVGANHLLFGTDHPFGIADPAASLKAVASVFGGDADATAVRGGNAVDLFGE